MPDWILPWLSPPLWGRLFWTSYAAFGLFELWVWARDRRAASGRDADRGSLFVLVGLLIVGLFGAFYATRAVPQARIIAGIEVARVIALALIWLGLVLRFWAISTLGAFFRRTVHLQDGHRMVTTGPYRIVRNPAYLGSLMTLVGVGLGLGNWVSVLSTTLAALIGYGWRIRVEDAALGREFGEVHAAYRRRKKALIPFVW